MAGVEGSSRDLSQSFRGALGMATKPGISVLAIDEGKRYSYSDLCVCNEVVHHDSMLAFGYLQDRPPHLSSKTTYTRVKKD